ncbi:hypothetical protein HAX54_033417 [Datura stramonium]|uniref:Acylamino-acid-releasing enzyme N-terminal domain-containing protein n=1 Tax=Datura stramonium TaxID=4076 RepID=A0ABS8VCA4_DATST|nr:hypothetical protein [Datura stramonium]
MGSEIPSTGRSQVMFSINQPNLLENKKRKYASFTHISKEKNDSVQFHWDAFPIEMGTASLIPSPSGSKLLVVQNAEKDSPTRFEIWSSSQVERGSMFPSIHGSVYSDGWFEGISWNSDETLIAYIAEEPVSAKPTFTYFGSEKGNCPDKDCNSWKGQGDWEEGWGEAYAGKRLPKLFVININSGEALFFVYVRAPCFRSESRQSGMDANLSAVALTESISSAFFLVFSAVDSGAHNATDSLHRIDWSIDAEPRPHNKIVDMVPVVMCAEDGCFPGLYCSNILSNPWLSDGRTMILSSAWGSTLIILTVNVLSIQPHAHLLSVEKYQESAEHIRFSWDVLTLDGDNIIAVCSSPVDVLKSESRLSCRSHSVNTKWNWLGISIPITKCSER